MKPLEFIVYITALVIIGLGLVFVGSHVIDDAPEGWKFIDLITILLTTAVVVITALGIGIAILGVWGYNTIQSLALKKADEAVPEAVAKALEHDGFKEMVRAQLDDLRCEDAARRTTKKVDEGDDDGGGPGPDADFPQVPGGDSRQRAGGNKAAPKRRPR